MYTIRKRQVTVSRVKIVKDVYHHIKRSGIPSPIGMYVMSNLLVGKPSFAILREPRQKSCHSSYLTL